MWWSWWCTQHTTGRRFRQHLQAVVVSWRLLVRRSAVQRVQQGLQQGRETLGWGGEESWAGLGWARQGRILGWEGETLGCRVSLPLPTALQTPGHALACTACVS